MCEEIATGQGKYHPKELEGTISELTHAGNSVCSPPARLKKKKNPQNS